MCVESAFLEMKSHEKVILCPFLLKVHSHQSVTADTQQTS